MKNREPRTTVLIPARMRTGGAWADVRIRNVSSRGLMLENRFPVDRGTYLEIARNRLRITGRVVWTESGRCGIRTRDDIDLIGLTEDTSNEAALSVLPAKIGACVSPRSSDRRELGRTVGRLMEFAALAACAAGGAGIVAHTAYVQMVGTLQMVEAKL